MKFRRASWVAFASIAISACAFAAASCGSSDDSGATGTDGSVGDATGSNDAKAGDGGKPGDAASDGSTMTFDGGVTILEYQLGDGGPIRFPVDIALGGDGNMWFTESNGHSVGRITPAGVVTEFDVAGGPQSITQGTDDAVWFASQGSVGRTSYDGGTRLFPTTNDAGADYNWIGIAEGSDSNLWLSPNVGTEIGRLTMAGALTVFSAADSGASKGPEWMHAGLGEVWYGAGNQIGAVSTTGAVTAVPIPGVSDFGANAAVVGPAGNIWFVGGGGVGRAVPGGAVTVIDGTFAAWDITVGADDNLWFTEESTGRIGRSTPAGVLTHFPIPTTNPAPLPMGIARGPANTVWFTESNADKIGEVILN